MIRHFPDTGRPNFKEEGLPTAKSDHELVTDGTARCRAMARARDDRRVAREWEAYFTKIFDSNPPNIRLPQNTHLLPDSEALNEKLRGIAQTAITDWRLSINEHLALLVANATERESNPQTFESAAGNPEDLLKQIFTSESFVKLIATTVANTTKALADKQD